MQGKGGAPAADRRQSHLVVRARGEPGAAAGTRPLISSGSSVKRERARAAAPAPLLSIAAGRRRKRHACVGGGGGARELRCKDSLRRAHSRPKLTPRRNSSGEWTRRVTGQSHGRGEDAPLHERQRGHLALGLPRLRGCGRGRGGVFFEGVEAGSAWRRPWCHTGEEQRRACRDARQQRKLRGERGEASEVSGVGRGGACRWRSRGRQAAHRAGTAGHGALRVRAASCRPAAAWSLCESVH